MVLSKLLRKAKYLLIKLQRKTSRSGLGRLILPCIACFFLFWKTLIVKALRSCKYLYIKSLRCFFGTYVGRFIRPICRKWKNNPIEQIRLVFREIRYVFHVKSRLFWSTMFGKYLRRFFPRFKEKGVETTYWFRKPPELEFMSESSAAMLLNTAYLSRFLIIAIAFFFASLVTWASLTELDEMTRGQGKVIPSSRLQEVQNLEGGIIKNIYITEGQSVDVGQALMELDDTQFASSFRETELDYFSLLAKITRLRSESKNIYSYESLVFPIELENSLKYKNREKQIYKNRVNSRKSERGIIKQQLLQARQELSSVEAQVVNLAENYRLSLEEFEMTKPLVSKGVVSKVQLIHLEKALNDVLSQKQSAEISIPRLASSVEEVIERQAELDYKFESEVLDDLREAEVGLDQLNESKKSLGDRVSRTIVRSPVNGIIQKLHVTTLGGVVDPGMKLVDIIPLGDSLEVEMMVVPRDIAFIRIGLKAKVKLSAYDFTIYGGLDGEVVYISSDTIENEKGEAFYVAKIKTFKSHLGDNENRLTIKPGMQADVDILTGKKSLLSYILKPLLRAKSRAFTER